MSIKKSYKPSNDLYDSFNFIGYYNNLLIIYLSFTQVLMIQTHNY